MFFSEQLSVQPREKSMEDKARPIRDIMLLRELEERRHKQADIMPVLNHSSIPSANNTIDRSPTHQLTPGYVFQAEVKQSGTPLDHLDSKRSRSVLLLESNRANIRI